jgi:hypothetical protein
MLELVVIIVVALIGAALFFAASQSSDFQIHRYVMIKAPSEKIFPLIEDFHRWVEWSPWETIDADLKRTYSGAPKGEGAIYAWEGKKTGVGRMEIMRTLPPGEVLIKLDFEKPMRAHNSVEIMLEPDDGQTRVDWTMKGEHDFIGKVMSLFFSMDKMVGRDFEKGLAQLKAVAEK